MLSKRVPVVGTVCPDSSTGWRVGTIDCIAVGAALACQLVGRLRVFTLIPEAADEVIVIEEEQEKKVMLLRSR
jgi:hypothetical protein